MPSEDDDARHRREEAERRAKRKASKASKSDAQREKDRARKEYRQNILKKHGQQHAEHANKKHKKAPEPPTGNSSEFQKLFEQRAQGFQIDFRFRNAPPRPPVGPCFVGQNLDAVLLQHAQHYRALNTVEVNHRWKLHNESDLGVPLAPSAMNLQSYKPVPKNTPKPPLHKDDAALLDWKGSMGDTAAEELKFQRDRARAAARAAAAGRALPPPPSKTAATNKATSSSAKRTKKAFSRVLDESMQTWMKKTTYLSNDYSRRVHDFKSLAQSKQQLAEDLEVKQEEMQKRRSASAISKSFDQSAKVAHPTNKTLKPKKVFSVLPDSGFFGMPFTHVVVDKKPQLPELYQQTDMKNGLVTNVEKAEQNARMTCEVFVPSKRSQDKEQDKQEYYETVQGFDLDIIPLKEEDSPHTNFCIVLDREKGIASYIPIPSRIQLSTGRPPQDPILRPMKRRPETNKEQTEREERLAEIDSDLAEKHHIDQDVGEDALEEASRKKAAQTSDAGGGKKGNDDGEDDFGDDDDDSDDSGDEALFGGGSSTIVA